MLPISKVRVDLPNNYIVKKDDQIDAISHLWNDYIKNVRDLIQMTYEIKK